MLQIQCKIAALESLFRTQLNQRVKTKWGFSTAPRYTLDFIASNGERELEIETDKQVLAIVWGIVAEDSKTWTLQGPVHAMLRDVTLLRCRVLTPPLWCLVSQSW